VVPIRVRRLIEGGVNNSHTSLPEASISYLLLMVICLYNPRYIMHITLLFSIRQCLFEGSYFYAHFGAACGCYIYSAARIRGNMVCTILNPSGCYISILYLSNNL